MIESIKIGDSLTEYYACTPCLVCGEAIPIPLPYHVSPKICNECRKRLMKLLYLKDDPVEINIRSDPDPVEIAHVGYTAEQCGYEK